MAEVEAQDILLHVSRLLSVGGSMWFTVRKEIVCATLLPFSDDLVR